MTKQRDDGYDEHRVRMIADNDQYLAACAETHVLDASADFGGIVDAYVQVLEAAGMDHEQILSTVLHVASMHVIRQYSDRWGA